MCCPMVLVSVIESSEPKGTGDLGGTQAAPVVSPATARESFTRQCNVCEIGEPDA